MAGKTILVVDDDPHIRYMLEYKLGKAGYRVVTASNGQRAYEAACEHAPDLVITDLQMPGSDGLEFCTRMHANPETADIPAVLLTARGYKVPAAELAATSIRCLMDKPFSPRDLIARIDELLGGAGGAGAAA